MDTTTQEDFATPEAIEKVRRDLEDLMKRDGLSKADVARGTGIPYGTFTPWTTGKYQGDNGEIAGKVVRWMASREAGRKITGSIIAEPSFVETPTSVEVLNALRWAQSAPGIALVTLGPGMGKTITAKEYARRTSHAYRIVMRPSTSGVHSMMKEVAHTLQVTERDPSKLMRSIGEKLQRNGRHTLILVDEAQNLNDGAVDELRHLLDEYGCGIALLGNEDVNTRWGKVTPREGYGQLHRRIGLRIRKLKPTSEDIETYLAAWGIADGEVLKQLRVIGKKPGALGQISETIKFASILAAGDGAPIDGSHIQRAWSNRGGEA